VYFRRDVLEEVGFINEQYSSASACGVKPDLEGCPAKSSSFVRERRGPRIEELKDVTQRPGLDGAVIFLPGFLDENKLFRIDAILPLCRIPIPLRRFWYACVRGPDCGAC
jgi:hypothetical protein